MIKRYKGFKRLNIFFLYLSLFLLHGVHNLYAADTNVSPAPDCEINTGTCTKKSGAVSVTLDIMPKPVKAMKELTFTVTLKDAKNYENLRLTLQMPGMFMGNNEVRLLKVGDGKYTGTGVIPKCHSGRRLWSATLEMPGLPASETKFLFNVLY